ncbi:MAG: hypothetical protein IT424_09580 [Pirellulales bacterium]|nr:hypothetical protein [Pirellulales bacterium]
MRKFLGYVAAATLVSFGLWRLGIESTPELRALIGFLLFAGGWTLGLRIGSDSGLRLLQDLLRLNKVLADQNADLAEQNHRLLKRALSNE